MNINIDDAIRYANTIEKDSDKWRFIAYMQRAIDRAVASHMMGNHERDEVAILEREENMRRIAELNRVEELP